MQEQENAKSAYTEEEQIRWAYRLFFDREPENQHAIDVRIGRFANSKSLRQHFLNSPEFLNKQAPPNAVETLSQKPPLEIETDSSVDDLRRLMLLTQKKWEKLGKEKPYWSVLTTEQFNPESIASSNESVDEFYRSGKSDAKALQKALSRNKIDPITLKTCLDFGCGLGRVTRWLCDDFEKVIECDISKPHLACADQHLASQNISNIEFLTIDSVENIESLPRVDIIYSLIVLQHNPPPIMAALLEALLRRLNSNGVGYIQIPIYLDKYSFCLVEYLSNFENYEEIEMHILPQKKVFEIIEKCGCRTLEVITTQSTGSANCLLSYTFLATKT